MQPAPALPEAPAQEQAELELLPQTLHAVSSAPLTGDDRPVSETATWLADVLAHRGVDPLPALRQLTETLAATLRDYPLSLGLIHGHVTVN